LEDKIVKFTNAAIDDVILNENKDDGLEKMFTTVKFFQDHKHRHPISFSNASNKIIAHLLKMLSKTLEDAVLSKS
jgi:hypothetical protein